MWQLYVVQVRFRPANESCPGAEQLPGVLLFPLSITWLLCARAALRQLWMSAVTKLVISESLDKPRKIH